MTECEVALLVDWAAAENWNPGLEDAATFWATDPDGFLALEVDGQLAGGGSIVRHSSAYGFMGLFILRPAFRGRGLGKQLWFARRDRLRNRLTSGGCIGLDAVADMIPFYSRGGFCSAFKIHRFVAPVGLATTSPAHPASTEAVASLSLLDWDQIRALDSPCFPGYRDNYLKAWIGQPRAHALGFRELGHLRGYAVMRPCRSGWKIGPMFCASQNIASHLLNRCFQLAGEAPVAIDVPESNLEAIELYRRHGMNIVFECTRMFLGPQPELRLPWIYGVTTFELG